MNNIITQYNEWLLKQDITSMSNGLLSGKLGLCLYWYQQSRIYSNKHYEKIAGQGHGDSTLTRKFGSVYLSPRPLEE